MNFMKTDRSISISVEGNLRVFAKGTKDYDKITELLKAEDYDSIEDYINGLKKAVESKYGDSFRVENGMVLVKNADGHDDVLPDFLGKRVREFADEDLPYQPLLKFWERLNKNPSYDSVQRLFVCLDKNNHPLLPDGRFLAWKRVRSDRRDFYTGTFDNSDGAHPEMPRNLVDDNHNITCSKGLHIASYDYAKNHYRSGEGVMIEVAVDPKDIVSITTDYNDQKMRASTYEVLHEVEVEDTKPLAHYNNEYEDEDTDPEVCVYCGEEGCDEDCEEEEICDQCGYDFDSCDCED